MLLRQYRLLSAGLLAAVALLGAPSRSAADNQILIQEVNQFGVLIPGTAQYFASNTASFATPNFLNISVTATSNSGAVGSLTTTVSAVPASSFDATRQLMVVVTNDDFANPFPNGNALVENNAAASSGIGGGQNILSNNTQLLNVPLAPPASSTTALASGTPLGAPTGAATDTRPGGGSSPTTTSNLSGMPATFAIQQTIFVRANPTDPNGIATGSTLGGSASSIVTASAAPAAVPAPAGLVLGLIALPILGLRRAIRRKPANG